MHFFPRAVEMGGSSSPHCSEVAWVDVVPQPGKTPVDVSWVLPDDQYLLFQGSI